ncbi:MAG TPA: DUF885 family protein [Cyclobacteriaceae bacterium]
MIRNVLSIYLVVFILSGSKLYSQSPDLYAQTSEVNNIMVQFRADYGSLSRFYFMENTFERIQRFKDLNQEYLGKLSALDFDELNVSSRVDYILFSRDLNDNMYQLQAQESEMNQIKEWITFATPVYELEKKRRRGLSMNGSEVARVLNNTLETLQAGLQKLNDTQPFDSRLTNRAEAAIKDVQRGLEHLYEFYNGYDPDFTWWVEKPFVKLDTMISRYGRLMKSKAKLITTQQDDGSGIVGQPIGREEIIRQLNQEMIPYTPEELIEIANREFAWCDAEMLKASTELGFGKDWHAALEKVKNTYVPEGEQPAAILKLYNESIDFLKQNDLLTIPPVAEESWRMIMMTPRRQLVNPFFTGGEVLSISYPTNTMDHDDKLMSMRGNNPHFSRSTVHHELIAGHHLQFFMNSRYKTYRRFRTPFWTEGWALYWELLLYDLKFPQSPEDRIGMLFWRMHRCARIIFSLNYHLGKWTPQQCIDFLVDRVGHEKANAEGEVRRSFVGGYSPLYQVAYMLGGLQFWALKKELVDSGEMTYKEYHDAVLQENSLPVEMIRATLTNQSLNKDFKTRWKFYNLR